MAGGFTDTFLFVYFLLSSGRFAWRTGRVTCIVRHYYLHSWFISVTNVINGPEISLIQLAPCLRVFPVSWHLAAAKSIQTRRWISLRLLMKRTSRTGPMTEQSNYSTLGWGHFCIWLRRKSLASPQSCTAVRRFVSSSCSSFNESSGR